MFSLTWIALFLCELCHHTAVALVDGKIYDHAPSQLTSTPTDRGFMITSWHWNNFRITDHLWGEPIGHQWIPPTKWPVKRRFNVFLAVSLNRQSSIFISYTNCKIFHVKHTHRLIMLCIFEVILSNSASYLSLNDKGTIDSYPPW